MHPSKAKNWSTVIQYAESIRDGKKVACPELQQAVDRFFRDLENPEYEMTYRDPEFCIQIIEKTICHQQGERLDGTPLRGEPFLLEPFHKFIIYNLVGFKHNGTEILRFHEALVFIPRKISRLHSPPRSRGRCPYCTGEVEQRPTSRLPRSCSH